VQAKLAGTNKSLTIGLERERGLTSERLARWKRVMTQNKGMDAFEAVLEDVLNLEDKSTANDNDDDEPKSPSAIGKPASATASLAGKSFASIDLAAKPTAAKVEKSVPTSPASKAAATAAALLDRPPLTAASGIAAKKDASGTAAGSPFAGISGASGATLRQASTTATVINLAGHVVGAVLGLALGYYLLCFIRPDANVLELRLPGIQPPAAQQPNTPKNTPSPSP
jgi:hypothetical protein